MSRVTASVGRGLEHVRHPGRWLDGMLGGGPVYALVVLFGLNAVDELDRTAFGILLPEIRDEFGLGTQGALTLVAVVSLLALAAAGAHRQLVRPLQPGVASRPSGRRHGACFSVLTGMVNTLADARASCAACSGVGKATVDPTHDSLIADYYPPAVRPRAFSIHRAANAVGAFIGPLVAGLLAYYFDWRVPFIVFGIPTFIFVVLALRMHEPVRGAQERRAMGASEEVIATEEVAPSFAEGWRMVWKIETLRRIWYSLPFLATALIGFVALGALLYEQRFDLDERARGFVAASVEPVQLVGLIIGSRVGFKLLARDPGLVLRWLSRVGAGGQSLRWSSSLWRQPCGSPSSPTS